MSAFITAADYATHIDTDLLNRVTDDDPSLLDTAEDQAIEMMRGYLNARYDVSAIFSQTGNDRNPVILMYAVDIALYYLYSRLPGDEVPDLRVKNYDTAESWLRRVNKGDVNPPDLPLMTDGSRDYVKWGSAPQRSHRLT